VALKRLSVLGIAFDFVNIAQQLGPSDANIDTNIFFHIYGCNRGGAVINEVPGVYSRLHASFQVGGSVHVV
jgi:hypothetical protein